MASRFQNRLVGAIILVALGVVILPGLLDGKKQHWREPEASIPLLPPPDEVNKGAEPPIPATQPLSDLPEPGTLSPSLETEEGETTAEEPSAPPPRAVPAVTDDTTVHQPAPPPAPKNSSPPVRKTEQTPAKPRPAPRTDTPPARQQPATPAARAWVIQLGALRNADKVNEIIATLRLSGYQAWTVPAKPVAGRVTRIFVGPDASQQKLTASLAPLQRLTGLQGVVKPFKAR